MMKRGALGTGLLMSLCVVSVGTALGQTVIDVDQESGGANDGSSWSDAYADLQAALASAGAGDEIWVAAGTYLPGGNNNTPEAQLSVYGDILYSCVEGLLQVEPGEDPPKPEDFPGSIDDDPLVVDFAGADYHLSALSPCIDAADNQALPLDVTQDLDGNDRFIDDPDTPDSGNGNAPIVDTGAFEAGAVPGVLGDINGDGVVDIQDLLELLASWGTCPPQEDRAADFDGNGIVDIVDFLELPANWG